LLNAKLNCGSNDKSSSCKKNILKNACDEGISIACLKNEYNQKACKEYFDKKHGCNYTNLFLKNDKTGIRTRFFNDWCIEDKDFNLAQKCEGRDGGACYRLGIRQHKDLDYKEAEIILKKACRLIRNDACNFLKKNYPRNK
jgi:hypothetical protein